MKKWTDPELKTTGIKETESFLDGTVYSYQCENCNSEVAYTFKPTEDPTCNECGSKLVLKAKVDSNKSEPRKFSSIKPVTLCELLS